MSAKALQNIFKPKNYISNILDCEVLESVRLYALSSLSKPRYEHSLRVAQMAKVLCEKYDEDIYAGFLAGISHDMCKELDKKQLESLAIEDGFGLSETEMKKPSLLHGRACAVILQRDFSINDSDVLEAVSYHTFGKKKMCNIAKIVCIADKIEPGRPYMSSSKMKNLLKLSLDALLSSVLKEVISVRKKKKDEVFPEALWVLEKNAK